MSQKIVLVAMFSLSVSLFYFVSPSRGCGVKAHCEIQCFNSSGQQIGQNVRCDTNDLSGEPSDCACFTDFDVSGRTGCHSECNTTTSDDQYCVF